MKVFPVALLLALNSLSQCEGFAGTVFSFPSSMSLSAAKNDNAVDFQTDTKKRAATFAATVALGWGVASAGAFAGTLPASTPSVASSTVTISKEYADFSMPSYAETTAATINTNLKGDKFLLGDASKPQESTAVVKQSSAPAVAPVVDEAAAAKKAADSKAEAKAAQKAAQKAQKAAADAALNK